jgi:N-acetylglucosaminyldiphosphoundecaprenol N-acetyl-beta-D-mannosaminyltransferase
MHYEPLLDIPIHAIDYRDTISSITEWIEQRKRPAASIVQANVFSLVSARENKEQQQSLLHADLLVPDGMPLVWMLKRRGYKINDRVYGPDLMLKICAEAERKGWRCFLYGGKEETLKLLVEKLLHQFPSIKIVGTFSPPFRALTNKEDDEICQLINSKKSDILWIGLGSPKQDLWMFEHKDKLNVSVMHGVGAAFDFLSGQIPQAPRWMMQAGLEWLFRLIIEPKRLWKRYTITNIKFFYYLCSTALHRNNKDVK